MQSFSLLINANRFCRLNLKRIFYRVRSLHVKLQRHEGKMCRVSVGVFIFFHWRAPDLSVHGDATNSCRICCGFTLPSRFVLFWFRFFFLTSWAPNSSYSLDHEHQAMLNSSLMFSFSVFSNTSFRPSQIKPKCTCTFFCICHSLETCKNWLPGFLHEAIMGHLFPTR